MNKYMQEAKAIRASIDGLAANQTDEILIDNMAAFPHWNGDGVQYLTGMLVQYDGKLYRVIQPHNSQPDWTPDKVPALRCSFAFRSRNPPNGYSPQERMTRTRRATRSRITD